MRYTYTRVYVKNLFGRWEGVVLPPPEFESLEGVPLCVGRTLISLHRLRKTPRRKRGRRFICFKREVDTRYKDPDRIFIEETTEDNYALIMRDYCPAYCFDCREVYHDKHIHLFQPSAEEQFEALLPGVAEYQRLHYPSPPKKLGKM
jgi:hypothetical protein